VPGFAIVVTVAVISELLIPVPALAETTWRMSSDKMSEIRHLP
jgi:hypothetical protein